MLLTAARLLAQAPPERGGVKLVFEPAEETGQGARAMIEAGVLDDPSVDHALAFHVWSDLPTGSLVCLDGPAMAGVDTFELTVTGRGSHAARPEDGLDPIPVAAQVITAAQTLVSRRLPPHQAAVLSFTSVRAGRAFNVIPETARLKGTVRAFDPDARRLLIDELKLIADETAAAFGASARYQGFESVPPLVNDAIQAERLRAVASELLGAEQVLPAEPLMVGEDFGLFAGHVPSAMALLGCGRPGPGSVYPHHHPRFDIDERVLGVGVELWLRLLADP